MVERSKTLTTDQGEFTIRVVPGASDSDGQNWVSSIHGSSSDVYDGYVGSYNTALAALQAAQDKIGYVDRSEQPVPTALTSFYNDGRGVHRIAVRSQDGQYRAVITRQNTRLMVGNVYTEAQYAFDEAIDWLITDQSISRQFAVNKSPTDPAQVYRIRLNRDDDRPNCTFTIFEPDGAEIYTSDVVYPSTHDAVTRATNWVLQNT